MERLIRDALLAALALFSVGAYADDDVHWYVQIDNDVAFHTDRWYSSGVRIGRVKTLDENRYLEFGILQEIYTPDVQKISPFGIDRPYAGRLLFTAALHDFLPQTYRTLELDAGVRGESALGRQATQFVHHIVPAQHFDWSNQLPDEFDIQAVAVQTHDFAIYKTDRARWALHYGAVLGNQVTFVHSGVELRFGDPRAITPPALRFAATPPISPWNAKGWSGYVGASARAVLRNTLLSQNANAFGPPLERENGVYRFAGGIGWLAPWGALTFSLVQDSREFVTQHSPHRFGMLGLHIDAF